MLGFLCVVNYFAIIQIPQIQSSRTAAYWRDPNSCFCLGSVTGLGSVTDWPGLCDWLAWALWLVSPSSCYHRHVFDTAMMRPRGGDVAALWALCVTPMHKALISKLHPTIPNQSVHPFGSSILLCLDLHNLIDKRDSFFEVTICSF